MKRFAPPLWGALFLLAGSAGPGAPVMFVTHTPTGDDFANSVAVFGNHRGTASRARRGGDLYIRYDNGTLRNLTVEAGFGLTAGTEIAVRDPHVHWEGQKALFSMAVGGTTQNDLTPVYFQIYEVTGLGAGDTVSITRLGQPDDYNNVSPIYGTDDRILFTSDRPRDGDRRLYPQLDEYESTPTVTGLWRMNADGSGLEILDHSPSGNFSPSIDSFGRVIFMRWDHLQRDQQTSGDIAALIAGEDMPNESVTYDSEASDTPRDILPTDELFPERLFLHGPGETADPIWDFDHPPDQLRLRFNQFFPWMMNEDGTEMETLNHIGRHELFAYIQASRTGQPDGGVDGPTIREGFLQIRESLAWPGYYLGVNAPEFGTHAAGQVVALEAPPSANADDMRIEYLTHPDTRSPIGEGATPSVDHVGLFRDPMPRSDGTIWAAHSDSPFADRATVSNPGAPAPFVLSSRYNFRIRKLEDRGDGVMEPTDYLTPGINDTVSYFDNGPYRTVAYTGQMWELQPVEVIARPRPTPTTTPVPAIEQAIMEAELGGNPGIDAFRAWLRQQNLAVLVSRDVTVRGDRQQDYRLKVFGSDHETTDGVEPPKEIAWMQMFEGLQVRGYGIRDGRRVLAQPMRSVLNPPAAGAPQGGVRIAPDGSVAAFVPARRAMSWQTTEHDGTPSVRERYWITFSPGEVRSCANCHGLNREDVFGGPSPNNSPQALVELLRWWKQQQAPPDSTLWMVH